MNDIAIPPASAIPTLSIGVADHPLRRQIVDEVHRRPFMTLSAPVRVSHLALVAESAGIPDSQHVSRLCAAFNVAPPPKDALFFTVDFGPLMLRWEHHTEFSTYTFFVPGCNPASPFAEPALNAVPLDWLCALPGQLLAAVHLTLESREIPRREMDFLESLFGTDSLAGSEVSGGAALVWTDFRVQEDGFTRILVQDCDLGPRQAGRLVQRLMEMETYRLMALLAYPLARQLGPEISRLDRILENLAERMTQCRSLEDEQALLQELSELAFQAESANARASFRLAAAKAYYALVLQRVEQLRELRFLDLQTIGNFMERRLAPAMQTCLSAAERLESLATRIMRTGDLLRTRVDVALEAQNRDLLASMDRRARLQLRLQQTVEGLSVVVLSYYTMGLLGYVTKAIKASGLPLPLDLSLGLSVPLVMGAVWMGIRMMHKRLRLPGH